MLTHNINNVVFEVPLLFHSRIYTHVLNRHHWMYAATAFNHAYGDAGLFCINASGHPQQLSDLAGNSPFNPQ